MSEISIFDKSQEIRFETELYANTCERVANVLDDINATKANKTDVADAIQSVLTEMDIMEAEIYGYIDTEIGALSVRIDGKMDKPLWDGIEHQYIVVSAAGNQNLRPITLDANKVPFWTGNTFFNSPIFINNPALRVGINNVSPTEALDVTGSVRANTFRYNATTADSAPNKTWMDGTDLWMTDSSGVNHKIQKAGGTIFEHTVRGKRIEANVSGTYAINLSTGSHFALVLTAATALSFSNMILADETCAITLTCSGAFLETLPAFLVRDTYSDNIDITKIREYNIVIKKGGGSPLGRYNVINV